MTCIVVACNPFHCAEMQSGIVAFDPQRTKLHVTEKKDRPALRINWKLVSDERGQRLNCAWQEQE